MSEKSGEDIGTLPVPPQGDTTPSQGYTVLPHGDAKDDANPPQKAPDPGEVPPLLNRHRRLVLAATVAFLSMPVTGSMVPPGFGGGFWSLACMLYGLTALCFLAGQALGGGMAFFSIVINSIRRRPYLEAYRFRVLQALVSFITIALALAVVGLNGSGLPAGSDASHFDSALWRNPEAKSMSGKNGITPRQAMLADLTTKVLPGKSRAEIVELLGEPANVKRFGADLIYVTGIERGGFLSLGSEWLLIFFDEKGVFKRYSIAND